MNRILSGLCAALTLVGGARAAGFSAGGTAVSSNLVYAVVPQGAVVETIQAYGYNLGTLQLHIYNATVRALITNALAANVGSNLQATLNPGDFSAGDSLLIRDVSAGTYQRAWVHLTNGAGGIVITNLYATGQTVDHSTQDLVAGDLIYKIVSQGQRRVANDTGLTIGGGGGTVWTTSSVGPSTIEAVNNVTTLITNSFLLVGGTLP